MKPYATKPSAWTKPELKRLGEIKDVAGPNNTGGQGSKS
jgi:hypothetical protein